MLTSSKGRCEHGMGMDDVGMDDMGIDNIGMDDVAMDDMDDMGTAPFLVPRALAPCPSSLRIIGP